MNNLDRDEILIKDALSSVRTRNFDILRQVEPRMVSKKPAVNKGAYIAQKGLSIGVFAACFIVVCIAAIAVMQFMAPFNRIAYIIPEESTDTIIMETVISETVITEEEITEPLAPVTCPYYTGDTEPVTCEINIEVVAINVYDNTVDVYFTIEDLVSNRLDGDFSISWFLDLANWDWLEDGSRPSSWGGRDIIHRDDNGVVTIRARTNYPSPLPEYGLEIAFIVWDISFGHFSYDMRPVAVNLSDFVTEMPTIPLRGFSGGAGGDGSLLYSLSDGELSVLVPQGLNIDFGFNRINANLSAIGIVDGRFHIQFFNSNKHYQFVGLMLYRGIVDAPVSFMDLNHENEVRPTLFTEFQMGEYATVYNLSDPAYYREYFFDIDLAYIHEYTLLVGASGTERISVSWRVSFDVSEGVE